MRVPTVPAVLEHLPLGAGVAVVRDGLQTLVATEPDHVRVAYGVDGFRALQDLEHEGGWWAGYLSYDLGRAVEHVVPWAAADRSIPDLVLARYDARARRSHPVANRWSKGGARGGGASSRRSGARAAPHPTASPSVWARGSRAWNGLRTRTR